MLTAIPLVCNISDLQWVCRFLQRPQWLLENLRTNTFTHKDDVALGMWHSIAGQASEDSLESKGIFTPVTDHFRNYQEYGSYFHYTTKAWKIYIMLDLNNVAKL
jgi:hypothetical protein